MRAVLARQQMSWHLQTFRTKEDSKITVINVTSKVTSKLIAGLRILRETRPTRRMKARNQPVLSVDGKVILRPSASVSLRILDMRSSSRGIRPRVEGTKKKAM